ncbi:methylated-DNA--[protein]-cysteine S-methyltransferase [Chloroflexota bacterium]
MRGQLKHVIFNTEMGWVGILGSSRGIAGTTLPQRSAQEAHRRLGLPVDSHAAAPSNLFVSLMERLRAYYAGHRTDFPEALDIPEATPFQRQVWQAARTIPYGETRSYQWVAGQIGKPEAARAVGQALARNPLPVIVPCHRVVASDGRLGGFSDGMGMKRRLLKLEAAAGGD